MDYVEVPLFGKYSHLKCKLDKDWYQMIYVDGGCHLTYDIGGGNYTGYAFVMGRNRCSPGKYFKERIHQVIMDFKSTTKIMIDHINMDKLDNRSKNLRIVTSSQNTGNKRIRKDNKQGVYGMHQIGRNKKFRVLFTENKTTLYRKDLKSYEDAKAIAEFHNLIRAL